MRKIPKKERINLKEMGCLCKFCECKDCPYLEVKRIIVEITKGIDKKRC